MCTKHVVLFPVKQNMDSPMHKSCKPAMLSRILRVSRNLNLNLEHSPAHVFACSQWQNGQIPSKPYLIYRWILFITIILIGISSFACQRLPRSYKGPRIELNFFKFFIYFTNWGFILIAVQAGLALTVVHRFRAEKSHNPPCEVDVLHNRRYHTPLLCRVYWLIHTIATDLAFVITLVYWSIVFDSNNDEINALNLLVHVGNSVIMLSELAVTSHPIRAAHALYGAGAGLAYGLFSAFYYAVGGSDRISRHFIYPDLDWEKPGSAIGFVTLCAIVMVVAHAFATCLAELRMRLAKRLRPKRPQSDLLPTSFLRTS